MRKYWLALYVVGAAFVLLISSSISHAAQYAASSDECSDSQATPVEQAYVEILGCDGCPACEDGEDLPRPLEFFGPIHIVNQQPPNPISLSPVPECATALGDRESFIRFKMDLTNHLIDQESNGVITQFDFESMRFELAYHRGIWGGEASVRYPMGYLGSGFLDGFIREFHSWINQRSDYRQAGLPYQFRFVIATPEGVVTEAKEDSWHFGNLVFGYKHPLWNKRSGEDALAVRAGIKVPSRDSGDLLGIGGWDFQVGAVYQRQLSRRLRAYLNADYIFVGEGDWQNVGYQDTPVLLYALEYAFDRKNTLVMQWRSHRNPIQLGSEVSDKDSQELSYGWHHRLSDKCVYTFGMSEDARGMTAPDVIFMSYLKWEL